MSSRLPHSLLLLLVPYALLGFRCEPAPVEGIPQPGGVLAGVPQDEPEGSGDASDPSDPSDQGAPDSPGSVLVDGVTIARVTLNQAVEVPLSPAGGRSELPEGAQTPIVAGRPGLLRVYVQPEPGFAARAVRVAVAIDNGVGERTYDSVLRLIDASQPGDLDSTANVALPAALVTPRSQVRVAIYETDPRFAGTKTLPPGARWPSTGAFADLGAGENGGALRLRLVPLLYGADGSGRAPDTSADQIAEYRDAVRRLFPVTDVVVTVQDPVWFDARVLSSGAGWSDALYALTDLRDDLALPADEYLYGLVVPGADFGAYCRTSCVAGLSWRADDATASWARTSVGLGYTGTDSADTLTHELGHAHGRAHTPCGSPADPDPDYPRADGLVGGVGWDIVDSVLVPEEDTGDLMGYCRPRWTSDYTFSALSDRVAWVNAAAEAPVQEGWPRSLRVLDVDGAGVASLRGSVRVDRAPSGEATTVELLSSKGSVVAAIPAYVQDFPHTGGRALLLDLPDAHDGVAVRTADGQVLPM